MEPNIICMHLKIKRTFSECDSEGSNFEIDPKSRFEFLLNIFFSYLDTFHLDTFQVDIFIATPVLWCFILLCERRLRNIYET